MPEASAQTILGLQLRTSVHNLTSLWSNEERETYLLVPTTEFPLSVDESVWPQAFDWPERSDTTADEELAHQLFENFFYSVGGPNYCQFSLNGLELARLLPPTRGHVIAVGVQTELADHLRTLHGDRFPKLSPNVVTSAYLLGYDVCDSRFRSGLMHCGVDADKKVRLRKKFGASVNRHGLFDLLEVAVRFAAAIDELVPEHAPTLPVSLFAFADLH